MLIVFVECFSIDGDTTVLEEEDWAEVFVFFILFWNIISIELRYNGSDWNRIMERLYDVITIPMLEQMSRKGLVVFRLARKMSVILYGEFGCYAHFGRKWHFPVPHRFLDVGAVGSALWILPFNLGKDLHSEPFVCSSTYGPGRFGNIFSFFLFFYPIVGIFSTPFPFLQIFPHFISDTLMTEYILHQHRPRKLPFSIIHNR